MREALKQHTVLPTILFLFLALTLDILLGPLLMQISSTLKILYGGGVGFLFSNTSKLSKHISTALFWVVRQRVVLIPYRHLGTTYLSHLQGSRIKKNLNFSEWYSSSTAAFFGQPD
jgi:hypothetical protein